MKKKKIYIIGITIFIIIIIIATVIAIILNKKSVNDNDKNSVTTKQDTSNYEEEEYELNGDRLSQEELNEFVEYFNKIENNGFVTTLYKEPSEIDLNQVIYTGAGLSQELTAEQLEEFKKKTNIQTEEMKIIAVPGDQIENLYYEKTGEKLNNINERLKDWTYLENGNLYCHTRSDSKFIKITNCPSGAKNGNTYTVYANLADSISTKVKVTLEKQGDKYIFKSNESGNKTKEEQENINNTEFHYQKDATDEEIDQNFALKIEEMPEDLEKKIVNTDQYYKDLKRFAYERLLVVDTMKLEGYTEDNDKISASYYMNKDGKVKYRIMSIINKQDNTYKFEYYM